MSKPFAVVLLSLAGSLAWAQPGVMLFDRNHPLHFDHRCSEPRSSGYPYHRAPALFEKPAASQSASGESYEGMVLANVLVGWIGGVGGVSGVRLRPTNVRLELPMSWHGDEFGLALQLTDLETQTAVTGAFATEYRRSAPRAAPARYRYRVAETGHVDWARWWPASSDVTRAEQSFSDSLPIEVAAKDLTARTHAQQLALVLQNTRTEARLTLEGPVLDNLDSLLPIEKPTPRSLGLLASLNPFQRGGVWNWLGNGWRYRKCDELRLSWEREFSVRAARLEGAARQLTPAATRP